ESWAASHPTAVRVPLLFLVLLIGCAGSSPVPSGQTITPVGPKIFTVDLGQEMAGQLLITSSSKDQIHILITLGESLEDLAPQKSWLGQLDVTIAPLSTSSSPVSGFRFIQVVATPDEMSKITFSVQPSYAQLTPAAFTSGDPELDKI